MSNKIQQVEQSITKVNKEELEQALKSFVTSQDLEAKVGKAKIEAFFQVARAFGLNPFKREIHAIPRAVKEYNQSTGRWENKGYDLTIVTGYEVYIKRANESGLLTGFSVTSEPIEGEYVLFDESKKDWVMTHVKPNTGTYYRNMKCVATVTRKDWTNAFTHETFLNEVVQNAQPWKKQPMYMQKKVTLEQALRWVFPEQVGGLPYADDELPVEVKPTNETQVEIKQEDTENKTTVVVKEVSTINKEEVEVAPQVSTEAQITKKLKYARAVVAMQAELEQADTPEKLEAIGIRASKALMVLDDYPDLKTQVVGILALIDEKSEGKEVTVNEKEEDVFDNINNI